MICRSKRAGPLDAFWCGGHARAAAAVSSPTRPVGERDAAPRGQRLSRLVLVRHPAQGGRLP
jgi:hypothetical protein